MEKVKLSSKNQIVIPKAIRRMLGLRAGDELLLVLKRDISYILPKKKSLTSALKGIAKEKNYYSSNYLSKEKNSW